MQVPATEQQYFRFGPFRVDPASRELWNNGRKIPLQEKPFQILLILLEEPGQIVTREELQHRLWPAGTFVDFEHSINTAIKKVRETLEDNAEQPRYIETLPRRGYRFIGQLEEMVAEEAASEALKEKAKPAPRPTPVRHRWYVVLAVVVVAVVAMLVGLNLDRIRNRWLHGKISEQDTIVLADFSNSTGDPAFDGTLQQALRIALKQSPFLNVLSEKKVATTLRRMARPPDTVLTHEAVRELCQRAGSKAYIAGSIAKLDNEYALGLKAVNCQNGDVLAQELNTVASKEQVLGALGKLAARMRGQLGESLATVQKYDGPLFEITTSSLEALKAFSLGQKTEFEKGAGAALPFDLRAIELDPNFAGAYSAAAAHYLALGEVERARGYITKAFQLRTRLSEPSSHTVAAFYYSIVTGELDKAAQMYQELIESYPRGSFGNNLGNIYSFQGKYEKAADAYRHTRDLVPDNPFIYFSLAQSLLALQRFDESRQVIHDAQARKLNNPQFHTILYALAFVAWDAAAMAEQLKALQDQPQSENIGFAFASDTEAYTGHLGRARGLTRQSVESAIKVDNKEEGAVYRANAALREVAYGNAAEARRAAAEALHLAPASQGVEVEAALALAMAGNTVRAQSMAEDLNKRFPLDTQMQSLWLPTIRAQLALDRKNPVAAIDLLQAASPIELGEIPFVNNISCLYPTYIRGQAYLASGQGNAAASEFRKILDHGGIVWNCWTGGLARLGVARANVLQTRTAQGAEADAARARALAAYKDFLTLWKDADPDVPILKQARVEYAKLNTAPN